MATSLIGGGVRNAWETITASDDDEIIVVAVAGKKIRVRSFIINHGDTTASAITFLSKGGGAGTAIAPPFKGPANGGFVASDNPKGWFETIAGEALAADTGAGSDTQVLVTHELVDG